uniref:RanBD1 domain-containing protein n=1 Tax=Wuchereria bancrofti TaxID=6293 RepID=A0AAF5RV24_WUCBA
MYLSNWQKMKHTEAEKLFLDKMAVLNKAFLYFIQCSVKEMPDADLSPCVRDYLKHVEELDRTYGNMSNGDDNNASTDNGKKGELINDLSETNPSEKDVDNESGMEMNSSAMQEKSVSSAITLFSSTTNSANVSKFSLDASATSSSESEKRGRKRAKKGGPEGDDEEVIISNHNVPTSQRSTSSKKCHVETSHSQISQPSLLSLPSNSPMPKSILKRSSDSRNDSKTETEKGFQKKNIDDAKETDTNNKIPLFLFGQKDLKKNEPLKNPQNFIFSKSFSEKGLIEKGDDKKELNKELADRSHVTPAFSFLKPVVTEGNYEYSNSSKTKLEFKFGAPPPVQSEPDNEGEESEYVPPKPETVLAEEPKAIFSSKCSVFVLKGTEYEKLGVGQLHIKTDETDGVKKILLIRAATTTGTVWVNSYIDASMKHVIVDDVKLRISCVSSGSPSTYLLRLPKKEDRDQIVSELQSDNVSS